MKIDQLISPLDNRYSNKILELSAIFSESNLNKIRFIIELEWLIFICSSCGKSFPDLSKNALTNLEKLKKNFNEKSAKKIKLIEKKTNHDVKAVEYFIRDQIKTIPSLKNYTNLVHFGLTSEDVNSLSYAVLLKEARSIYTKELTHIIKLLSKLSRSWSNIPILSRTHGQPASPSTLGKEINVFTKRLVRQKDHLNSITVMAKFGGTTGNFHTLHLSDNKIDWVKKTEKFIKLFKVNQNPITTQIEPHDCIAELAHSFQRINNILIDLNQDIWLYIANDIFKLKLNDEEIGSSTMPHKVNPIDFENSEGNLGISNSMMVFFAEKLTKSRLQRDLSDSTVLRNLGVGIAYSYLGILSSLKGLNKLKPNTKKANHELDLNWQVLTEAIQIIMKLEGVNNAYELIKKQTHGSNLNRSAYLSLIEELDISEESKIKLRNLTPSSYLGIASKLAKS
tara:strand:- start:1173 stop:2525 length:1353 start_codon:yes stop_codon:yes gene_type:complete